MERQTQMHKWKYHTERPEKYTRHKVEISLKDSTENHSHNELQQSPELSIPSKAKVSKDEVPLLLVQRRLQIQGKVSQRDGHTRMSVQKELHICIVHKNKTKSYLNYLMKYSTMFGISLMMYTMHMLVKPFGMQYSMTPIKYEVFKNKI